MPDDINASETSSDKLACPEPGFTIPFPETSPIGSEGLVILDIFMPKLDGYHFCRLLKYDKMFKDIPIIIVSAGRKETDKQLGIACGGDEYVTKPYDMNKLLNLVENYLR